MEGEKDVMFIKHNVRDDYDDLTVSVSRRTSLGSSAFS